MTLHIRHMVAVAAAALVGGVMLAGYGGNAAAQETVCARSSHTKIFVPRTGKVECMQISKSLQRDNQQVQKQRQRVLQQRLRQDQLTRQLRARSNKQGATVRQRQIAQQQELRSRQRAAALRQKRLVNQQRALQNRQQRLQRR